MCRNGKLARLAFGLMISQADKAGSLYEPTTLDWLTTAAKPNRLSESLPSLVP